MDSTLNDNKYTGVRNVSSDEARNFYNTVMQYEDLDKRQVWRKDCEENMNFYHGKQWTDEEIAKNAAKGQYTLTINKVKKGINNLVGMLLSNKPTYHSYPSGDDDTSKSYITNKMLQWVWSNSNGTHVQRDIFKASATANLAFFFVHYNAIDKSVKFKKLQFDEVIIDPFSTDMFCRDADWIFIKKHISIDKLKEVYEVQDINYNAPTEWMQYSGGGNFPNFIGRITQAFKTRGIVYEGYHRIIKNGKYRIVQKTLLGYNKCYEILLPEVISDYPVIPAVMEDTGNPYKTGEIHDKKDMQRFLNKAHGVMILSAQLSSNPKAFIRENDIPDGSIAKFQENYSKPGSINILRQDAENPLIVNGQPINQAFYVLFQGIARELEFGLVPDEVANAINTQRTPPDLFALKESIIDSLKLMISNIEMCIELVGKVAMQYCKAYITDERRLRVVDDKKQIESFMINKQVNKIDIDNEQSLQQYVEFLQQKGMEDREIEDHLSKLKNDKEYADSYNELMNSVENANTDVYIKAGSMLANKDAAEFQVLMSLYEKDMIPPEFVVEKAPISNRKIILSSIDSVKQRDNMIASLQEEAKEQEAMIASLKNKIFDADRNVNEAKLQSKTTKLYGDSRAATRITKMNQTFQSKEAIKDLKREIEKIEEDVRKAKEQEGVKEGTKTIHDILNS